MNLDDFAVSDPSESEKMTIFNSRTPSDVTRISVGTVRNAKNVPRTSGR